MIKTKQPGQKKSKVAWVLKQLVPLTYWAKHKENGKTYLTIWRMYFGKCFDIVKVEVK